MQRLFAVDNDVLFEREFMLSLLSLPALLALLISRLPDVLPTPDEMGSLFWSKQGDACSEWLGIPGCDLLAVVRAVVGRIL